MKRALSLLITFIMVISLFPASAIADQVNATKPVTNQEETTVPEEITTTPEEAVTPDPTATPQPTSTQELSDEPASSEVLFLRLLDCDTMDRDGSGHTDVLCGAQEILELCAKAETNGKISYRWQVLDESSELDDPYVDINLEDEPTADESDLRITAERENFEIEDYYRCVITAVTGDDDISLYSYFTLKDDGTGEPQAGEPNDADTPSDPENDEPLPQLELALLESVAFINQTATLTIQATLRFDAQIRYQWQVVSDVNPYQIAPIPEDAWVDVDQGVNNVLTLHCENLEQYNALKDARYRCVVSANDIVVMSNAARLFPQSEWMTTSDSLIDVLSIIANGTCGSNLTWSLSDTGVLTISGTGSMSTYTSTNTPWKSYLSSILRVTIEQGATSIGSFAFNGCVNLTDVVLPSSVTSIGSNAFAGCVKLTALNLPLSLTSLGSNILSGSTSVKALTIPATLSSAGSSGPLNGSSVESVVIQSGMTRIPNNTLLNAIALTSVTIPATVNTIGSYAFSGCVKLESCALPASLTGIESNAFYVCSKLSSLTIPSGVTSIGSYAFSKCTSLTSLTLPQSLASMGSYILNESPNVKSLTIPATLTSTNSSGPLRGSSVETVVFQEGMVRIPSDTLYGASSVVTVSLPSTIKTIGSYAFSGCSSLASITLPSGLEKLENYAFNGCSSLGAIALPSGVMIIGDNAFSRCTSLASLVLPAALTTLGSSILSESTNVKTLTIPATLTSAGYNGPLKGSSVETVVFQDGIAEIPNNALYNASAVTTVTIPSTVEIIGSYGFANCTSLLSISLPEGVEELDNNVFSGCTSLTQLTLPQSLVTMSYKVVSGCTGIKTLSIPASLVNASVSGTLAGSFVETVVFQDGFTRIPTYMLINANTVTTVSMPSTVETIGGDAFYGCTKLTSITLSSGLIEIEYYAFYNCSSLQSISIPAGVTTIGDCAFSKCIGLTELTLPQELTYLGERVLNGSTGVKTLNIPSKLTSVHAYGPLLGSSVETVNFMEGLVAIPADMLDSATTVTSVSIALSVKSIGNNAFYGCTNLSAVTLPEGLKTIGNYAFRRCSAITDITIPTSVTSVGNYAFDECSALVRLIFFGAQATLGSYAFGDCTNLSTIALGRSVSIQSTTFNGCVAEGTCGTDLSWSVDFTTRKLSIQGSGEMANYAEASAPWYGLRQFILRLSADEQVTSIGNYAFDGFSMMGTFALPSGIQSIGGHAFQNCVSLERVTFGENLIYLGAYALGGCTGLKEIIFSGPVPQLGDHCIPNLAGLTICVPETNTEWAIALAALCPDATVTLWDDTLSSRDIVLVLDVSGSMDGDRIDSLRTAAAAFVERGGGKINNTRIAIITYNSSASLLSGFTENNDELKDLIGTLSAGGGTEYLIALNRAAELLASSTADTRSLVLFSDGEPNDSVTNIFSRAETLRESYNIYTVGLSPTNDAKQILIDIAGSVSRYFQAGDVEQLVDSFEYLAGETGNDDQSDDAEQYYGDTVSKMFRISTSGANYPSPAGFTVNVDGVDYNSGKTECFSTDDLTIDFPAAYTGDVVISKEGFHTYTMPYSTVDNYNVPRMYRDSYTDAFAQALLYKENPRKRNLEEVIGYTKSVYEAGITSDSDPAQFFVDINWNGQGEGAVWLQQGEVEIPLVDDDFTEVDIGQEFHSGAGDVFLYWQTGEGAIWKQKTGITMITANQTIPVDLGEKVTVDGSDMAKTGLFADDSLEIDFTDLTDGVIPLKYEFKDGIIKGTIGIGGESKYSQTTWGTLKEAFAAFKRNSITDQGLTKILSEVQDGGHLRGTSASVGVKGEAQFVGIFEGYYENGEFIYTDMQAALIFKGSLSFTQRFIFASVPGYVKLTLSAKIAASLDLMYDEQLEGLSSLDHSFNITFSLTGEAGPGWEGFISGGIYGNGDVMIETRFPIKKSHTQMFLKADFGFVGSLLGIDGKWTCWESDKKMFYDKGKFCWTSVDTLAATEVKFEPLMQVPEHNSEFNPEVKGLNEAYPVIKTDTATYSDPQLSGLFGDTKLMVWVDDVSGRTGLNTSGVYYSYLAGETWSEPALIEDDGTNDYMPSITIIDGNAYVLWHDYSRVVESDEDMETIMNQIDISVAVFNPVTNTMQEVNTFSNPGYDHVPCISGTTGAVTIEWKNGRETETTFYAVKEVGGWSGAMAKDVQSPWYSDGAQELPDDYEGDPLANTGGIQNLNNASMRAIVYRREDDAGVLNLFALFNTGEGWGEPIQLTKLSAEQVVDAFSATLGEDNKLSIAANVQQSGEEATQADLSYYVYDANLDVEAVSADYDRLTLAPTGKTAFYIDAKNISAFTADHIKLRLLDENGTVLYSQLCSDEITSGETKRLYLNYALPSDSTDSKLQIRLILTDGAETNQDNNSFDISLLHDDISVEEVNAATNDIQTSVTVRIVNRGSNPITNDTVQLRLGTPDGELLASAETGAIQPLGVSVVTMTARALEEGSIVYVIADDLANENLYGNNSNLASVTSAYTNKPIWVDSITIVDCGDVAKDTSVQMRASVAPANAPNQRLQWSIISGSEYASIDADTGLLTAQELGTVVVRATAMDRGVRYSELEFDVVDYATSITGSSAILAGKTAQYSGGFIPSNLTNTSIAWSLTAGDEAYASISATGLLSAKALTHQQTITVIARAKDGVAKQSEKQVTIYPAITMIQILNGDINVTGKTLVFNSNETEPLTLTSTIIPVDARDNITWVMSATTAATLQVTNEGKTAVITPVAGKSGKVTVTAKANDGSGKSSIVTIQISAISNGVTVSDPKSGILYAGKSTQLSATFSDPKPTNTAVKWVMSPEYDAYATLSATGLLTAKAVTDEVIVKVYAVPADGGPESAPYEVTIKPLTSTLLLKRGEMYVTNTTQAVDIGHETSLQLTAVAWPDTASQDVTFSSSAPLIATVDETGAVTVLKTGLVTITAKAMDGSGKIASVKLNIVKLPQQIEVVSPALALRGGASATYRVKNSDAGALIPNNLVRWTLDGDYAAIATITTGGVLTTYAVNKPETVLLKAEVIGNEGIANTSFEVTIYPETQSLKLYSDTLPLTSPVVFDTFGKIEGGIDEAKLTVKTIPGESMQQMTWTSSNIKIATVTDGVVKPVWNAVAGAYNKGSATITAKTKDGTNLSVSTMVQVLSLANSITLESVTSASEVVSGGSLQLNVTLGNVKATNTKVYYSIVTGAEFASVSTSGLVTAKTVYSNQPIVVKASAADGSCEDTLELTVTPKEADPLVIQAGDGNTTLNNTRQSYDIKSAAAAVKLTAVGYVSSNPVIVKWTVSPSTVGKVIIISGVATLQSLKTGVVTVTATDAKGRTATFTAEFYKPATSLTITPPKGMDVANLMLNSGKTMQLTGVISPITGVTTAGVNWYIVVGTEHVKDTSVASISSTGLVTAKPGLTEQKTLTIYAVTKNAPYLTDSVTITLTPAATGLDILFEGQVINNLTQKLDLSVKTMNLSASVYPDIANQTVAWSSSDKLIATIEADGTVTALKAGTVTITAKADGKAATFKLVISVRVTGLTITSKTGFTVRAGGTLQLTAAFTPTTATDKRVSWTLLDDGAQYASLSATGLVTAKAITQQQLIKVQVTSLDDKTATDTKEITIYPATTKVLILDESEADVTGKSLLLDLNEVTEMTLKAKNLPSMDGGALQGVTWKSSNTAVLRVDSAGVLTAVKNMATGLYYTGTVTITATASDGSGKTASVKVFVGYLVKGLTLADGLTVKGGSTLALKPTFDPLNATNKALKWTIKASDTPYATISSTGVLTTKKLTEARDITIYCEALDGSGVVVEIKVRITI